MITPSTLLAQLLTEAELSVIGTSDGPPLSYELEPGATTEQIAQADAILAALPDAMAAAQARQNKYAAAAAAGISVPGVSHPLAATPDDWQYYTNLLAICQARKIENVRTSAAALLAELTAMNAPTVEQLLAKMIVLCSILTDGDAGAYERPCAIATVGTPHVYSTNQQAIDGALVYADAAQTQWEAALGT